jgi:malonyl CoA-acyl carrier protein transacylase
MGRELRQREPVFREALARCEAAMRPFVDWSLEAQLLAQPEDAHYRLDQIDVIQPVLLALEIAFAELWRAWGVPPDAVIGHSMGEVAAAYIAGAITLDDAMRVICRRSQLMRRTSGQGAMAVVELTAVQAQERLVGRESQLSVAVSNSPRSTVVAGETAALDALLAELEAEGIFCRKVKVDVASHSPQMEPLQPELHAFLADMQPQAGHTPIYATSQARVTDGADMDAAFWVANLRQPVQFAQMVEQLLADGFTIFIEMSPHPILLPAVQQVCAHVGAAGVTVASTRRDEPEPLALLAALGQLYTVGYPVDWARRYPSGQVVSLPTYPWQRELFWYEPPDPVASRTQLAHPFLDDYLPSATGEHIWEGSLSLSRFAYLADHRVGDTAVFPAAGFIEMMLAAAQQVYPDAALAQVSLLEALPLTDEERHVQIILKPDVAGTAVIQFFSRLPDATEWTLHASAQVPLAAAPVQAPVLPARTIDPLPAAQHYRATAVRGLPYGPAFQGVQQLWPLDDGVFGELALPEAAASDAAGHLLPPALLDAAFQLLLATLPPGKETYLPISVDKVWSNGRFSPAAAYVGYAMPQPVDDGLQGDVFIFADGQLLLAATGLHMQPLRQQTESVADWMYTVNWEPQPLAQRPQPSFAAPGQWLILADAAGLGQQLADRLRAAGELVRLLTKHDVNGADPQSVAQRLAALPGERPLRGIIHLWSLDKTDPTGDHDLLSVLHLVQALGQRGDEPAPRLWLVTQGVAGAALWGLGRVLDHEHPELSCQRIDLAADAVNLDAIWAELWSDDGEREVALRPDGRFVSRLVPFSPQTQAEPVVKTAVPGQPYRVTVTEPGILDNLHPLPLVRRQPAPGEVELEVCATGLNFMNVMAALGALPGYADGVGPLGIECAGVVTAVAADVTRFSVGDAVMGIAFDSLGSHAITDARLLVPKPEALSFAEAAAMPIVFLTAYYALCQLGRMRAGERVLIHAGTGGVGQAAIQLAQHAGAEIFATAGTPEKRAYLRDQGIGHVMDSRSLAFADEVLAAVPTAQAWTCC